MNSRFARLARLDPWTALRVFAVVLFLVPARLMRVYRTEIMIALSLNAYFGSHVLLQVNPSALRRRGNSCGFLSGDELRIHNFLRAKTAARSGVMVVSENARRAALARVADRVEPASRAPATGVKP